MLELPVEVDVAASSDPPSVESDLRNKPVLVRVLAGRLTHDLQRLEAAGRNLDDLRRDHGELRLDLLLAGRLLVGPLVRQSPADFEGPDEAGQRRSDTRRDSPVARGARPVQIHRVIMLAAFGPNDVVPDAADLPDLEHLQGTCLSLGARPGLIRPRVAWAPFGWLVDTELSTRHGYGGWNGRRDRRARRKQQERDEAAEPPGHDRHCSACRHDASNIRTGAYDTTTELS